MKTLELNWKKLAAAGLLTQSIFGSRPAYADLDVGSRPHNTEWRCRVSGRATARFVLKEGGPSERRIIVEGLPRPLVVSLGAAAPDMRSMRSDSNIVSVELPTESGSTLVEWREVRSPSPCSDTAGVFTEIENRSELRVDCTPKSGFWSFASTGRARCDSPSQAVELSDKVLQVVKSAPTYVEIGSAPAEERRKDPALGSHIGGKGTGLEIDAPPAR